MTSSAILVVDDEPEVRRLASAYLRRDGFTVRTAATGRLALETVAARAPDLVVLDLVLPDVPGESVCSLLRGRSSIPILMLSGKSAESDRLRGLAVGADDYLVKPFSPRELVARVRAILRRSRGAAQPPADLLVLDGGRLEVDLRAHEARLGGRVVPLTIAEFRLLADALRGGACAGSVRTVKIHVQHLRAKMDGVEPGASRLVATVEGVGYRLEETR